VSLFGTGLNTIREKLGGVHAAARRGNVVSSITGGAYGAGGYFGRYGGINGEGVDYAKEAGLRYTSSIVFALVNFAVRQLEAIPLQTYTSRDNPEVIPNHPCTLLMERPNPWYDGGDLTQLSIFTEMAWGNSYCYKHRNPNTGKLIALEFLPQGACYPFTWPGTGEFISEYRIMTVNGYYRVPPLDVLQLRYLMDPVWPIYGMTPLQSCFPELAADILAQRHEAAILANGAVSSGILSPKQYQRGSDTSPFALMEWGPDQCQQLEKRFVERLTGDAKNGVLATTVPMQFDRMDFDPKALNLEFTTGKSEQRISAVFLIQPVVAGLGAGLRDSNNRASMKAAVELTFKAFVIPYARRRARQYTRWLIPELGQPGQVMMYDESKIEVMRDLLLEELVALTGGPCLTRNEGRAKAGYSNVDGGDMLLTPSNMVAQPADVEDPERSEPAGEDPTTETVDDGAGRISGRLGQRVAVDRNDDSDDGDTDDGSDG
jgi:phage portal protein BeeE